MKVEIERQGLLFCLCGPAGVGKNACADRLMAEFGVKRLITVTSRSPRENEQEGNDYHFFSRSDFESKAKQNYFFEWEEIHGNLYGTPRDPIDDALRVGSELLLIIDIKGTLNFKKSLPTNTCITFIMPPSFDELSKRMQARGSISREELAKRLKTADSEWQLFIQAELGQIDYLVVNEDLENAYKQIKSIFIAERNKLSRINRASLCKYWKRDK